MRIRATAAAVLMVVMVVMVATLAACTADGGAGTTATTPPATAVAPSDVASTAPAATGVKPPSPETSPEAVGGDPLPAGSVLVAGDSGVDLVARDGGSRALTSLPAVAAYDDGAGGVVLQGLQPPGEDPPSAAVMWLPPHGGDAVTVVEDGAADEVQLWDAGAPGGEAFALVTGRTRADSVTDSTQTLQSVALPGGHTTDLAVTGGWESGARLVTYGGERIGVQWSGEGETTFALLDWSGEPLPARANPLDEPTTCLDEPGCPTAVGVTADGDRLAWLEVAEDGHRLVVQPVDGDQPDRVVELPASLVGGARVDDVRVTGDLAIVNRVADADGEVLEALRVDLSSGEAEPLPLAGHAAPTRG